MRNLRKTHTGQSGFTLIELLVVISIIGLLSSTVLASVNSARQKARIAQVLATEQAFRNAVELYFNDNGTYPCAGHYYPGWSGNPKTCLDGALSAYLGPFPTSDPWGNQYVWHWHPGSSECTFLMSFGPNGGGDWWSEHNCVQDDDDIDAFLPRPSQLGL